MTPVVIESPYAGDVPANVAYARRCVLDSLRRGEAPFASHLFFTDPDLLDDVDPNQRALGISAGLAWGSLCLLSAVYVDRGVSGGMIAGMQHRLTGENVRGRSLEFRSLRVPLTVPFDPFNRGGDVLDRAVQMAKDFASLVEGRPERTP